MLQTIHRTCLHDRIITKGEFDKLVVSHSIGTQTTYFLSKIHKDKEPVKLRPIISCTNGPTYTPSGYLDKLLQQRMKTIKSYLKSSKDLIQILKKQWYPPQAYLATLDIESLYINLLHEEYKTHKTFLLNLLKYVLKHNVFQFNNEIFSQLCGIPMGTKLAPTLATIYVGDCDEKFIQER